jgi:hypothetical protein
VSRLKDKDLLLQIFSNDNSLEVASLALTKLSEVDSLKEDINDKRIKSLNRVYGRSSELYGYEKNEKIIDAFDCYTYGEYFNCIKLCNQLFDDGIFDISLIDIFVHSHIYQGIAPVIHMNSIKDILVKNLYHIILKDDKTLVSFVIFSYLMFGYLRKHTIHLSIQNFDKYSLNLIN